MRALFITLSLLFAAVAGTVYAANEKDPQVSEIRKVEAFSSVEVTSVATVYFTQSNNYSLKIEGREEYVTTTTTEVKNDRLIIGFKNKKDGNNNRNKGRIPAAMLSATSRVSGVRFSIVSSRAA